MLAGYDLLLDWLSIIQYKPDLQIGHSTCMANLGGFESFVAGPKAFGARKLNLLLQLVRIKINV